MSGKIGNAVAAVLAFISGMALVGAGEPAAGLSVAAASSLVWGRCPASVLSSGRTAAGRVVRLECATLKVPLDYRNPEGPMISVAVSRLRSPEPRERRGALLLNPGGPGGSGLGYPLEIAKAAPQSLLDAYDLIGFDPRGVGHSTPVTCGLTFKQALQVTAPWPRPGGAAELIAQNAQLARTVARQCAARSGSLLSYITTTNTARDMNRIRAALGAGKIAYYGISSGSYLGAVYGSLFPWRTDRVVLDSVTNPDGVWRRSGFLVAGPGVQIRFPDFARFAAARNATYQLGTTIAKVRGRYFRLAARLDRAPMRTASGTLTGDLFRDVTFGAMYSDQAFAFTARFWQAVSSGDARTVGRLGDQLGLWDADAFNAAAENSVAADLAVICDDASWPRSVRTYQRNVRADSRRYPIAGALAADIWPCAFWPNQPTEPPVRATRRGPHNILLVNNLRDPVTPFFGAAATRREFGPRARLVGVDQGGHGVYLINSNGCANAMVTRYLVTGAMPAHDTICPARQAR